MLGSKPTSCNIDSNIMPSNIKDLVCGNKTKANGSSPPIVLKWKLDDSILAFLRTKYFRFYLDHLSN